MNSEIFKPSLLPDKDKTEFIKQVQQEYKHIGSIKYRLNLTLWQFNIETGELKSAKVTIKEQLVWTSKGIVLRRHVASFTRTNTFTCGR